MARAGTVPGAAADTTIRRQDDQPDDGRQSWDDFSLMDGGPLRRLGRALGVPTGQWGVVYYGLSIAFLTWLPLVVFAAMEQVLTSGPTVPFLDSLGTHVRLLLVIPLFFVAEADFDGRVQLVIRSMVASQLVSAPQLPRLASALGRVKRWRDAGIIEAGLVLITLLLIWSGVRTDLPGDISTWRNTPAGTRTFAGWWYAAVSLPVFQFLLWRWLTHLLMWAYLLWQICSLDLQLLPTHPDLAGGLGGFGGAHVSLAPLNFGATALMVASLAEQILYAGMDLRSVVLPLGTTLVGCTLVLVAPVLIFAPTLLLARRRGLREYGVLAAAYTRAFDVKWLRSRVPETEPLLGSTDVQSLADLANAFDVIRQMRIVPIGRDQILILVAAAALPMAPLLLFVIPLDELVIRTARSLLHV